MTLSAGTSTGGTDDLHSMLGIVLFSGAMALIVLAPRWLWDLRRKRLMMKMAREQGLEFRGRRLPEWMPEPPVERCEFAWNVWFGILMWPSRFYRAVYGTRDGLEVFCCDYAYGGRSERRGTVVAVHGVILDLDALRERDVRVITEAGWTFAISGMPFSFRTFRLKPWEITAMWDRMRSLLRSEARVDRVVRDGDRVVVESGDGMVIRPRHEVPKD